MRYLRSVSIIILSASIFACNFVWNGLNRDPLRNNVVEVLALADDSEVKLSCRMVDTTRTGYCLFAADMEEIEQIISLLQLEALETPGSSPAAVSEGQVGCLSPGVLGKMEGASAYWIGGRPTKLALSNGGQFEYLFLLYQPNTNQTCVQVSYAYG